MSDTCKTVIIQGKGGEPLVINETDYNDKKHKLFKGDLPTPATTAPQTASTTVVANNESGNTIVDNKDDKPVFGVIEDKRRKKDHHFVVVNQADASPIVDVEGINIGGYPDAKSAWDAIMALNDVKAD